MRLNVRQHERARPSVVEPRRRRRSWVGSNVLPVLLLFAFSAVQRPISGQSRETATRPTVPVWAYSLSAAASESEEWRYSAGIWRQFDERWLVGINSQVSPWEPTIQTSAKRFMSATGAWAPSVLMLAALAERDSRVRPEGILGLGLDYFVKNDVALVLELGVRYRGGVDRPTDVNRGGWARQAFAGVRSYF